MWLISALSCLLYQAFGDLQEEKLAMDGGLRLSNIVRNYIHADRGDMPAERQVTWRGCARDWITEGEVFKLANVRLAHLLAKNHKIGFVKTRQEIDKCSKAVFTRFLLAKL